MTTKEIDKMTSDEHIRNYVSYADLISILNAFCGFFSILIALNGNFALSAIFILIAVIFDSLDGYVARLTKRDDELGFGKNIDSLSDVISFGVAPGILLYFACLSYTIPYINIVVAFLIIMCGILRLARFNVLSNPDKGGDENFVGLPIPSTALLLSSFYLSGMFRMDVALIVMVMVSVLMISTLQYPKFRGKKLLLVGSLLILTALPQNILSIIANLPAKLLFIVLILYLLMVPCRDLHAKLRRSGPNVR